VGYQQYIEQELGVFVFEKNNLPLIWVEQRKKQKNVGKIISNAFLNYF
jgi:hypothetical protein